MPRSSRAKSRGLLACALFLAGCFNPDDIFPIHGSVTSVDPVEGQVVRLLRDAMPALSSTCTNAQPFKETTVDAEGRFSFDVFRAQAMKLTGGSPFCFRVETTFASGTLVSTELLAIAGEESLPPFPDWRAQPARVDGVLRFEPVEPLPAMESFEGTQLAHRAEWRTEDGGLAWAADDLVTAFDPPTMSLVPTRAPLPLNDFALEDFSGTATLHARMTTIDAEENAFGNRNVYTLSLQSGDTLALAGTRRPFSRGLPCSAFGDPCPLTDGALTPVDAGFMGINSVMTFTLPTPTSLSAIVLRSVETKSLLMAVQLLDADGGSLALVQQELPSSLWNASVPSFMVRPRRDGGVEFAPSADPRFISISLDAGVNVSAVRIGFAGGSTRFPRSRSSSDRLSGEVAPGPSVHSERRSAPCTCRSARLPMQIEEVVKHVAATFERDASSQAVFGPAIELEHHKIVPVAVVAGGGGGGLGSAGTSEKGQGGGLGFGVNVRPVGFIHEANDHVIFTPIHVDPQYRSAQAEVAAFGLRRVIDLFASFISAFLQRSGRLPARAGLASSEVTSPS